MKSNNMYPILLIILMVALSYINSFSADFVCDDLPGVVDNHKIHSLKYVPDYFSKGVWENSAIEIRDNFLYRPFSLLFLALNYMVWGNSPFGFHLMNILLHATNSIMVFFIIKEIVPQRDINCPLWGSLLFAVHPIHVESVAWISGSTDLILTFFTSAAFLSYIRYKKELEYRSFIMTTVFFAGALLSKEPAIVFPFLVLAWDLSRDGKVYLRRFIVLLAITALYLLARIVALGGAMGTLHINPAGFSKMAEFAAGYIKLLVVPWPLGMHFKAPSISTTDIVLSATILAAMVWTVVKDGRALFFLLWVFATLFPSLSLAFYANPRFAERFAYLPSLGFVVVLVCALQSLKVRRKVLLIGLSSVVATCSLLCFVSTRDWRNDEAFYGKVIKTDPDIISGYHGLANYYERKGRYAEAISYHLKSLEFTADNNTRASIHDDLGRLYGISGNSDESVRHYEKEIALVPGSSMAYVGIGNNYLLKRDYGGALKNYARAYEIDRKNYEACYNLAILYEIFEDRRTAEKYYQIFLKNAPEDKYAMLKATIRKGHPELR